MLDRASIERLSKTPEKNAPMLNVALAEEGTAPVLLALARSPAVGPEALDAIGLRIEREGERVGWDPEAAHDDEPVESALPELDRLLAIHAHAPAHVRDAILGRHRNEAFFVLAMATHPRPTLAAIERAIDWPAASAAHDRTWIALIDVDALPPLTLEEWTQDTNVARREAVARIARDAALLDRLAADRARQVRRAVASNRFAVAARQRLAASDPAPEVRGRASAPLSAPADGAAESRTYAIVDSARFASAVRAMESGGVLQTDVVRALSTAADLDPEGALLAGAVLPRAELAGLAEQMIDLGFGCDQNGCFAAGVALRPAPRDADGDDGELTEIVYDLVKALARTTRSESRLTGKAKLAAWAAEGLARAPAVDRGQLVDELARGPLGAEWMVLARGAALRPTLVAELCEGARRVDVVPAALVELAWKAPSIPDATVIELAARVPKAKRRSEELPEDDIDLDPTRRPLDVLERAVLAITLRASVSPRAALPVVALDARRVRYVLSALPQWKGRLIGTRLARVLRQHAGALSAARAEGRARGAKVEAWTQRMMNETEAAVALAVGHLTGAELAARIASGRQVVDDGVTLSAGAEARAAIEGADAIAGILSWASAQRTTNPAALAVWLLLEKLDRVRAPTLVASSVDALAGKAVVHPSVCDALALIERREPGRLETIHPQSPRGRATLASAIARAYRALGGTREERQS